MSRRCLVGSVAVVLNKLSMRKKGEGISSLTGILPFMIFVLYSFLVVGVRFFVFNGIANLSYLLPTALLVK